MTTTIKDSNDLLSFLVSQAGSRKDWFGYQQQKLTAISLAHEIATHHADKMTAEEVVDYAVELNQIIFDKIIQNRK
jgi:hypothetical protein